MSDSAIGLLEASLESPSDDTPRLILADWLTDRGDPASSARGELIRLQCQLAGWVPEHARRAELHARVRELIDGYAAAWLGPLRELCEGWSLERGLFRVTLPAAEFASKRFGATGAAWLRSALVGSVRLESAREVRGLASAAALEVVRALDLGGSHRDWEPPNLDGKGVRRLVRSPYAAGLRRLALNNNALSSATMAALAGSERLAGLEVLDVRNNRVEGTGLRALLDSPSLTRLSWLDLHGNDLEAGDIRSLAAWRASRVEGRSRWPFGRMVNSLGMEFVRVPAGTFLMGSPKGERGRRGCEGPVHEVEITKPFWLGAYLVTQGQYRAVTGENPALHFRRSLHHPVEEVSWFNAVEFCEALSDLPEEKAAGRRYRLPREAEWEHACRAGTTTPFSFGSGVTLRQVNFTGGGAATCRVGSFPPNAFGLYDMHGNACEWCSDWFDEGYYRTSPRQDPAGPAQGEEKVVRGGGWSDEDYECRCAARVGWSPEFTSCSVGFRVVCEVARGG